MPAIDRIGNDNNISGADRLLGSDNQSGGATRNFVIDDLADFYSSNGTSDPGRYSFPYTFVLSSDGNVDVGQFSVDQNTAQTLRLSEITSILINTVSGGGINILPLLNNIIGGQIKIQASSVRTDNNYAIFTIDSFVQHRINNVLIDGVYDMRVSFVDESMPNAVIVDSSNVSIVPIASGGTGGGAGTTLTYEARPDEGVILSNTGGDAIIPLADNQNAGLFSPDNRDKLASVAEGADSIELSTLAGSGDIVRSANITDAAGIVTNYRFGGTGSGPSPSAPTIGGEILNFNRDRFNNQIQTVTLRSTYDLHNVDTFTSIQFEDDGTLITGSATTGILGASPYSYSHTDTSGNIAGSSYTSTLGYSDQNGAAQTETSDAFSSGNLAKIDPTVVLRVTRGSGLITTQSQINSGFVEFGDIGLLNFTATYSDNQWTPLTPPVQDQTSPISITASQGSYTISTSRQYNSGALNTPLLSRTVSASNTIGRQRSLRYGTISETDYQALASGTFSSNQILNLANFNSGGNTISFGTADPDGAEFTLTIPNGHRVYILYGDNQVPLTGIIDTDHNVNNISFYNPVATSVENFRQYFSVSPLAASTFRFRLSTN